MISTYLEPFYLLIVNCYIAVVRKASRQTSIISFFVHVLCPYVTVNINLRIGEKVTPNTCCNQIIFHIKLVLVNGDNKKSYSALVM